MFLLRCFSVQISDDLRGEDSIPAKEIQELWTPVPLPDKAVLTGEEVCKNRFDKKSGGILNGR